jgi:hypothetical protein
LVERRGVLIEGRCTVRAWEGSTGGGERYVSAEVRGELLEEGVYLWFEKLEKRGILKEGRVYQ